MQPVVTCRQSPYLHKPAVVIVTSFSLWRLAPTALLALAAPFSLWRHSHYWAGHAHRYGGTYGSTDILPRLIYKDIFALADLCIGEPVPVGLAIHRSPISPGHSDVTQRLPAVRSHVGLCSPNRVNCYRPSAATLWSCQAGKVTAAVAESTGNGNVILLG